MPDQTLDDQTAARVAAALEAWQGRMKPNPEGGTWIVSLAQYSSYDSGKRVLVSIERLTYPTTASGS
jgi:hypothetical protein